MKGRRSRPGASALGPVAILALSFGCIVGSGWVVVLGDWLRACGPWGVVLGMLAGCSVMLANSGAYAELISRFPVAGGEFVFAQRLFGDRIAFFVGWLYTLSLLAVVAFEATALPWVLETLFPAIKGPLLYMALGFPVTLGFAHDRPPAARSVVAILNCRGTHSAAALANGAVRHLSRAGAWCWWSSALRSARPITGSRRCWEKGASRGGSGRFGYLPPLRCS